MKGITPVIAVILLLLITVSMSGFAFLFLQRSLEQTSAATEENLQQQLDVQRQTFVIDAANDALNAIYVRHTGTVNSDTSKISMYQNDTLITCVWDVPGAWTPSTVKTCTAAALSCSGTTTVDLKSPGGIDSIKC